MSLCTPISQCFIDARRLIAESWHGPDIRAIIEMTSLFVVTLEHGSRFELANRLSVG